MNTKRVNIIFKGAIFGLVLTVVLLLVPIIGVRKNPAQLVLNWQEMVLYVVCVISGTVAGARIALKQSQLKKPVQKLLMQEPAEPVKEKPTNGDSAPRINEPIIEESLAGGPRKKKNWWAKGGKERTKTLAIFLYLTLYINCSVLCQKLTLGILRTGELETEIIRGAGLALCLAGLYVSLRTLFVPATTGGASLERSTSAVETVDAPQLEAEPQLSESDAAVVNEPDTFVEPDAVVIVGAPHATQSGSPLLHKRHPHIPPTRLSFLKKNPICAGWLLMLTGLPLIFLAWFPLLAIPGIFVGMNWLFAPREGAWHPN